MAKDLIIGGISNYDWSKVKYWVNSIEKSGFKGDVVLCATNITNETIEKLISKGVKLVLYGSKTPWGIENSNKTAPHVERFFYIWNYLSQHKNDYRFTVVTDVRDVIFQSDPMEFLKVKLHDRKMVISSEGLKYKDEPWNNNNMLEAFGPFFQEFYGDRMIYNVGVIGGYIDEVCDTLLALFQLSMNRSIPVVDQVVFNFMMYNKPYSDIIFEATNSSAWAAQLGTTRYAIESGAGDLGMSIKYDPSKLKVYEDAYQDIQPEIRGHEVFSPHNKFCIVHQWDRVDILKNKVEEYYGD